MQITPQYRKIQHTPKINQPAFKGLMRLDPKTYAPLDSWFFRDYNTLKAAADEIKYTFPQGAEVLDYACSNGEETISLKALLPDTRYKIIGYDTSESALKLARRGIYTVFSHWHDSFLLPDSSPNRIERSLKSGFYNIMEETGPDAGDLFINNKKTYFMLKKGLPGFVERFFRISPEMKEEIDIAFKENSKEISDGARSYLEDVLKEKNSLPSKEELKELLDDAFVAELEKWKLKEQEEEFVRVDEGDRTLFLRTPEGVKKQLGLVAKDKNNIPSEHVQEFLANTFLDKGNKESIKKDDGNAVITNSSEVELDREAKKNLSSLYSKLDNNFKDTRDNMNKELINDLGKNKKLQDFILQGGKVDVDFLKLAYECQPEAVINSIYDMNIAGTSDEMIQNIYSAIQEGRKEVFEKALDVEYRPSDIVFTTSSDDSAEIASYNPVLKSHLIIRLNIDIRF